MLHDTVEDTLATVEEIRELFGDEVAQIVDGVTKLSKIAAPQMLSQEVKQAENFRKMLLAMAQDIRVILVKLADRTHNMRTLDAMPPEKQTRVAQETLDIYAPLANRLGIGWIKTELEDLSFRYLKPKESAELEAKVSKKKRERERYIEHVSEMISERMAEASVQGKVNGRFKHSYSIFKKMRAQDIEFEQVPDVIAFRIITDSVAHCYGALGLIHQMWKPVPGRFKDFIALPKANMYQSLHTTVLGPLSERIEIQIRTEEMHSIAEEGIAAHWVYKEGRSRLKRDDAKFAWLRQLLEWQQDLTDPREFLDTVKVDLFSDEVFVFTPKGEVKSFPRGASPIDFAYAIHSAVGDRCVGAKVNGKIVPLRYKLHNGDQVEVTTSPQAHPSKDWLTFVKTSRAQQRVRAYIREQQREQSLGIGRELLERELKTRGASLNKLLRKGDLKSQAEALGFHNEDELLVALGYGKVQAKDLAQRLVPESGTSGEALNGQAQATGGLFNAMETLARKVVSKRASNGVVIGGVDDVLVRFGRCCNPVPGDAIIGFITRGRGVTVHTGACEQALATDPERRVDVTWDTGGDIKRPATLRVLTSDRPGILAEMSSAFARKGIRISQANCRSTGDERAVNTFEVSISDLKQLNDVMRSIEQLDGVYSVERV